MKKQSFRLCDVLTLTTGRMLSPEQSTKGLRTVLEFLSGEELFVTDLVRVAVEMVPRIYTQHPELRSVQAPEGISGQDACQAWVAEQAAVFGEMIELTPEHQFHRIDAVRLVPLKIAR